MSDINWLTVSEPCCSDCKFTVVFSQDQRTVRNHWKLNGLESAVIFFCIRNITFTFSPIHQSGIFQTAVPYKVLNKSFSYCFEREALHRPAQSNQVPDFPLRLQHRIRMQFSRQHASCWEGSSVLLFNYCSTIK